jgi:hypothetical protein
MGPLRPKPLLARDNSGYATPPRCKGLGNQNQNALSSANGLGPTNSAAIKDILP